MDTKTETTVASVSAGALDHAINERIDALLEQRLEAKLAELKAARTPSMTIIATKGTLDWAYPPFILASTAAALGWDVSIFFTFYGLELLKKDLRKLKVSPLGNPAMPMKMPMGPQWFKAIQWNIPNAVQSLIPAYEAFATKMMKKTIKNTGVAPIGELRGLCVEAGVNLIACQMTVDLFGYKHERIHSRSQGILRRRDLPADGEGRGRLPVHLTSDGNAHATRGVDATIPKGSPHVNKTKLILALLAAVPVAAQATDGYFSNGYGMKANGMGGAAIAVAIEPFGGAINPGAMSFLDSQWQLGVSWFSPDRSASRTGSGPAGIDASVDSGSKNFFIPEFAVNWKYGANVALGVTVYGNGGMNTDYPGGQISAQSACSQFRGGQGAPYNLMCGSGSLGVDLMQLMIAPYASWQFTKGHSIGIAPVIAYQRFQAEGMQAFDNPIFSTSPGSVTNNGYSDGWGFGARVGYMGQFTEQFAVGVAYQSKISMDSFDGYKGLFAQEGALRHSVELHHRSRGPADQAVVDRARLPADFLRRRAVREQPEHLDRLLRSAADGGPRPAQLLPGRQRRRWLRLAERRRVEDRRPVRR